MSLTHNSPVGAPGLPPGRFQPAPRRVSAWRRGLFGERGELRYGDGGWGRERATDGSESTFPLSAAVRGRGEGSTIIAYCLFAFANELLILILLFILTGSEKGKVAGVRDQASAAGDGAWG